MAATVESRPGDTGDLRVAPRRFGAPRIAFFRTVERFAGWCGGRAFYQRVFLGPGRVAFREETLRVAGLAPELEGFTLAHVSDLHAGPFLGTGGLAPVVEEINARVPDVVVLTGDFVTRAWDEVLSIAGDLARLAPRRGAFAVFGNHDYRGREEHRIEQALDPGRVRFLRNASARVVVDGAAVALVGLEDLEEGRVVDVERARAGVRPGDVEIVLCHNPLGADGLARPGCAAVLSGHTHGGQIALPLVGRFGPGHPGDRRDLGATAAITSRGLGVVGLPLRLRARPEVVWLTLTRAGGVDGADSADSAGGAGGGNAEEPDAG